MGNLLRMPPNPLVPALEEAVKQALTEEETAKFANCLRPQVEGGQGTLKMAIAYLWALKK